MPEPIPSYHVGRGPFVWRIWWRFGWGPVIRVVHALPVADWRQDQWLQRIDFWAMDHIGRATR